MKGGKLNGNVRFPADLVQRNQWCLWQIEAGRHGRPTKVPYRPDGRKAASNDPRTWSTFSVVSTIFSEQPGAFGGIGFFFAPDDGICGVDLDVSLDSNGNLHPWAKDIVERFQNTYRAVSVSGGGLHILCRAVLPGRGRNFNIPDGPIDFAGKRAQIGLFDRNRFFALTGRTYQQPLLDLANHQGTIDWLIGWIRRERWTKP